MKIVRLKDIPSTDVSHNSAIQKRVMLCAGELGRITQFAQSVSPPGAVAEAHAHADMGEVFFVESGTGEIVIDGTPQALEPGTCAVVGCHEVHEVRNTGNTDLVITYFGVEV